MPAKAIGAALNDARTGGGRQVLGKSEPEWSIGGTPLMKRLGQRLSVRLVLTATGDAAARK